MKRYTCNAGMCGAQFDVPGTIFDNSPSGQQRCCPSCGSTDFDSRPRCIVCHDPDDEFSFLTNSQVCPSCGEKVRVKASDLLKHGMTNDEFEAFENLYDLDLEEKNVY